MSDNPPDWAIVRALDLADNVYGEDSIRPTPATVRGMPKRWTNLTAFARYIAEHEEPPADPVTQAARELFIGDHPDLVFDGTFYKAGAADRLIRAGHFDGRIEIIRYVKALRRGIEIERERQS